MTSRAASVLVLLAVGLLFVTGTEPAYAYGGPGSVLSGIGTLLAAVAAIFAALFGFIWFPLKRLLRRFRDEEDAPEVPEREGAVE